MPGTSGNHQAPGKKRNCWASRSILPHDGMGRCTPSPRKLSEASRITASPTSSVASTSRVLMMLGKTWRSIIRGRLEPATLASRTKSISIRRSTSPRSTLANPIQRRNPMTMIRLTMLGPKRVTTVSATIR